MSEDFSKGEISKPLGLVSFDNGFHFKMESGSYTGMTAVSLVDFLEKLKVVDVNSILFHYPRGDFQKWIENTLGEKELANRLCFIKTGLSGEKLRKQLLKIVKKRVDEIRG